jgi:hypothetical protein
MPFAPAGALIYHISYPGFASLTRGCYLSPLPGLGLKKGVSRQKLANH